MTAISPELDRVMRGVGGPASPDYQNLRTVIESSPLLLQRMNLAVEQGHLKHFAWMHANENAGASYDAGTQTVNLKQDYVLEPERHDTLTFIMGHEIQHGFNRDRTRQGYEQFSRDVMQVLQSGQPVHDYTPAMQRMLAVNRNDEASAHIAGWNAVVSRAKHDDPGATLSSIGDLVEDVSYINDFLDTKSIGKDRITVRDGLTLNPDLSITPDAPNIEATAQHYFDKAPQKTGLGYQGNSDYANYYATNLVGSLCQSEMLNPTWAGKLTLDMQGLNLQEPLLEQNGISLGAPGTRCTYFDARSPAIGNHFDHTADSHRHVPINGLPQPVALPPDAPHLGAGARERQADGRADPAMPAAAAHGPQDPRNPLNRDHGLYSVLQRRIPDASEDRLVQFTAACHVKGITAENLGDIFLLEMSGAIHFHPTWPPGPAAHVDLKAPMPSPQQAMQQVQAFDQQQAVQQAQVQQMQFNQTQGLTPGGQRDEQRGPAGEGR